MSTQHGKRPKALICCFCGFEARSRNKLVLHQKAIHKRQGGNGIAPFKVGQRAAAAAHERRLQLAKMEADLTSVAVTTVPYATGWMRSWK